MINYVVVIWAEWNRWSPFFLNRFDHKCNCALLYKSSACKLESSSKGLNCSSLILSFALSHYWCGLWCVKCIKRKKTFTMTGQFWLCLRKLLAMSRPHFVCLHSLHVNVLLSSCGLMANTKVLWAVRLPTRCAKRKRLFPLTVVRCSFWKSVPFALRVQPGGQQQVKELFSLWGLSAWLFFFFFNVPLFRTQCGSVDLEHINSALILKFTAAITLGVGVK